MPRPTRDLQLEYQRQQYASRRAHYFARAGSRCVHCGMVAATPVGFEADHIDPSTKVSHKIWSWSIPRLEAELSKCQWLCGSCHKAKTAASRLTEHGTLARYRNGCDCDLCLGANTTKSRIDRAKQTDKQRNRDREAARLRMQQLRARSRA